MGCITSTRSVLRDPDQYLRSTGVEGSRRSHKATLGAADGKAGLLTIQSNLFVCSIWTDNPRAPLGWNVREERGVSCV